MRDQSLLNVIGDTHISGGQFNVVNNFHTSTAPTQTGGFERLHAQIAVTALHDALNSFESGKCHANTRQAVLNELFQFIQEDPKTRKNWILWLSGPAGSGKTTIARTMAFLCDEKGLNQASFFFCRMDLTRNGIKSLVATLAYQIACRFPNVKDRVVTEIERRPHIFGLSVESQFRHLITEPLINGGWKQEPGTTISHPIVCVIDALDECEGSHSRDTQSRVVQTLHKLVSNTDSPVIFVLASRPEANLRMSFNRIRNSISRVYLDNSYNPSADIRRFVEDSFDELRIVHPFASLLPRDWPGRAEIDAIVAKSSGQFLYAAIVIRYVSSPWCHPATSLDSISQPMSGDTSAMPFTDLDNLFAFILGKAMHLPIVLNILSCHILSLELSGDWFSRLLKLYGYTTNTILAYLIDIVSLAEIDAKSHKLILHNESLVDFLVDPGRSGSFHLNPERASYDMVMRALGSRSRDNIPLVVDHLIALLPKVTHCTAELELELLQLSREAMEIHPAPFLPVSKIRELFEGFFKLFDTDSETRYLELFCIWSSTWQLAGNALYPATLSFSMNNGSPRPRSAMYTFEEEVAVLVRSDTDALSDDTLRFGGTPKGRVAGASFFRSVALSRRSMVSPPNESRDGDNSANQNSLPRSSLKIQSLIDRPARQGSAEWFRGAFQDAGDLIYIQTLLASIAISEATGMLFSSIASILGCDSASRAHILSAYPSLFKNGDTEQMLSSFFGRLVLCYMRRMDRSEIYHMDVKTFAIQVVIQLLYSTTSYQGNLFGDLGALLVMISRPTASLTTELSTFATFMLESQLQVHVLDFATFLDGLAHMYFNNASTKLSTPGPHSDVDLDRACYLSLLRHMVQFWASRHQEFDPQLLGIPEFSGLWEQFVRT